MFKALPSWERFKDGFNSVSRFLASNSNIERWSLTCCTGHLAHFSGKLVRVRAYADWRWGSIMTTLADVLANEAVLRATWSEVAFLRPLGSHAAGQADAAAASAAESGKPLLRDAANMSKAIADEEFWSSLKVMRSLQEVLSSLEGWAGGCPCHGDVLVQRASSRSGRQRCFETFAGGQATCCAFAGCRAPECAAGELVARAREVAAVDGAVVWQSALGLPAAARQRISSSWSAGVAAITDGLSMKTAFWHELPHHLGALASWSDTARARCAQRCLRLFEQLDESFHHPLSRLFLGRSGSLRPHVVAIADGAPLASCPRFFRVWCALMRFWPIIEVRIEGKDARMKQALDHAPNFSSAYMSRALRMPQLLREIEREPSILPRLIEECEQLGPTVLGWCSRVGLRQHPGVIADLEMSRRLRHKVAKRVMYHADVDVQHLDAGEVAKLVQEKVGSMKRRFQALQKIAAEHGLVVLPQTLTQTIPARASADDALKILQRKMKFHHVLERVCEASMFVVYSMKLRGCGVLDAFRPLTEALGARIAWRPLCLQGRDSEGAAMEFEPSDSEQDRDVAARLPDSLREGRTIFFSIVQANPGTRKLLKSTVAHGSLPRGVVTIRLHKLASERELFKRTGAIAIVPFFASEPLALDLRLLPDDCIDKLCQFQKFRVSFDAEAAAESAQRNTKPH